MSNLHAPTVPSGPTSTSAATGAAGHLSFAELERKKVAMEEELKALGGVLDSHGVDMNTSLLSADGFPRSDIDVAQVRTTRSRIIHLRNDYKELMNVIEKYLHEHFASLPDEDDEADQQASSSSSATAAATGAGASALGDALPERLGAPFARVNSVVAGSPAEQAGLKAGDEIRSFGYVDASNHDGLKKVGECVQGNEGRNVFVRVSRPAGPGRREELRLTLTPRRDWGGRGLLGCHILPL